MIRFYHQYEKQILYLVFGVFTTIINYGSFWLFVKLMGSQYTLVANAIAFVFATAFAYVTNKCFVFRSGSWKLCVLLREAASFTGMRLFSFGVEELGLLVCMTWLHVEKLHLFGVDGVMISKIVLSFIAVLMNYFFAKWLVFRERGASSGEE